MGTKLVFLVPRAAPLGVAPARGVEEPFCWLGEPEINWRNWELFIVCSCSLRRLVEGCGMPVGGGVVVGAKVVDGGRHSITGKVCLGLGGPFPVGDETFACE
jgi:hypothetical protein